MCEPLPFAQCDSGQEPDAISQDEPDSYSGYQRDSVGVTGCESLSGYEPDSDPEPVPVPEQLALA